MNKFWMITAEKGYAKQLAALLVERFDAHGDYIGWSSPHSQEEILSIYIPISREKEFMIMMDSDFKVFWVQDYDKEDDLVWD